jgi:hypothetical protein
MSNIKVLTYVAVATMAGETGTQKQPIGKPFGLYADDDIAVSQVFPQPYRWGVVEENPPYDLGLYHIRGRVFLDEQMSFRKQSVQSGDTLVATNFMDMEVIGKLVAENTWPASTNLGLNLRATGWAIVERIAYGWKIFIKWARRD